MPRSLKVTCLNCFRIGGIGSNDTCRRGKVGKRVKRKEEQKFQLVNLLRIMSKRGHYSTLKREDQIFMDFAILLKFSLSV
jgi:hypothetical protein